MRCFEILIAESAVSKNGGPYDFVPGVGTILTFESKSGSNALPATLPSSQRVECASALFTRQAVARDSRPTAARLVRPGGAGRSRTLVLESQAVTLAFGDGERALPERSVGRHNNVLKLTSGAMPEWSAACSLARCSTNA